MKRYKQLTKHDPENGVYGDCFRTTLACLLEIEPDSVPHFMDGNIDPDDVWAAVDEWLKEKDLVYFSIPFMGTLPEVLDSMGSFNPGIYYLLSGKSPRGGTHEVIALNNEIVHDPNPAGGGLVAPCENGYYWVGLLIPLSIHGG